MGSGFLFKYSEHDDCCYCNVKKKSKIKIKELDDKFTNYLMLDHFLFNTILISSKNGRKILIS